MEIIFDNIAHSIEKYHWLMKRVHEVNVANNSDFQRTFNGFYRIQRQPEHFYNVYYEYLEKNKTNRCLTFEEVVTYLYHETGKIHASFSSKLLATVRPNMPIWDKFVLKNLGLRAPYYYEKERLQKTVQLYNTIRKWYTTSETAEKLLLFNQRFPDTNISDVKKIDFILWATR